MKKIFAIVTVIVLSVVMCVGSFASHSLDRLFVNATTLDSPATSMAGSFEVEIEPGDKMYILGWAAINGAHLVKIYWTLDGEEKECADLYRDREDVFSPAGIVSDAEYTVRSGFGFNEEMMEMLGVDTLKEGEYEVEILALFDDETIETVKDPFTLVVGKKDISGPVQNNEPKTLVVELIPDGTTDGVEIEELDDGTILCETDEDSDPWISFAFDEIDTSIYTSFTVVYEINGTLHGNNIYARDVERNPAYTPTAGTWTMPAMQGKTERTFSIPNEFGMMKDTLLTGIRFPGATSGGSIIFKSITFHNPNGVGLRDFSADEGDALSYDQIFVNDKEIANGNDAVIAAKKGIDGRDGTVESITFFGWYGNANSETESFGYKINNDEIVYVEDAFADTENEVKALNENNRRFKITAYVSELKGDGNVIWIYAKLANGDVVKLNRFDNRGGENEKDREIYVIYNAPEAVTPAPTEAPTATPEPPTDAPTDAPAETPTNAPEVVATEEPKKDNGCGGFAFGGAALIALAAAALVIRKKH
ncbi:MAG: PT domain-containing protein [Clostridia bacterium]|nr:PT domain-containing protein [Clostridia bacterium]